jgi:protein-disulfide isomerase
VASDELSRGVGLALAVGVLSATALAVVIAARNAVPPPEPSAHGQAVPLTPAVGPNPSKVYVTVYSDFACPVCARAAPDTRRMVQEWPGEIRFEFRHLAPSVHRTAEDAAVASLAAHRQGKFWEMHDALFATRGGLEVENLRAVARQIGLDMERYERDFTDPAVREQVREESREASALGASGTPAFVINGKMAVGWGSWYVLRDQVERELQAVNALVAQGKPLAEVHALRAKESAKDEAAFALYKRAVLDRLAAAAGG